MSRRDQSEDRIIGSMDRARSKAGNAVERQALHCRVASAVTLAVKSEPEHLRAEAAKAAAETSRTLYAEADSEANAISLFGRLAHTPVVNLHKAVATANAEKLFAANGPQPIGIALAAGLRSLADELDAPANTDTSEAA